MYVRACVYVILITFITQYSDRTVYNILCIYIYIRHRKCQLLNYIII